MVLGKLPVPGRPTYLDYSRPRVGAVWTFFLSLSFRSFFPSLWETARYRLKYCLKGPLNPKQPTNQLQETHLKDTDLVGWLFWV